MHGVDIQGAVVILDEAHNIVSVELMRTLPTFRLNALVVIKCSLSPCMLLCTYLMSNFAYNPCSPGDTLQSAISCNV